jgi:hypothetical protein
MPHIRGVIHGIDIIMLQNPLRVEVINKPTVTEVLMDPLGLFFVYLRGDI